MVRAAAAAAAAAAPGPKAFRPAPGDPASTPGATHQDAPTGGGHTSPIGGQKPPREPSTRTFVATRRAIKEWRALGASRWVIRTLLDGVQIPWTRRPPRYRRKSYILSPS